MNTLSLQTDKLILMFYSDLADVQTSLVNSGETAYGKVLLSTGYHSDREVVELNLIQANNLPGLDKSGTCITTCTQQCDCLCKDLNLVHNNDIGAYVLLT